MQAASSRQFGKYNLVAKLATGGMAEIYLASYLGLGGFEKFLVIKKILPSLAEEPKFVEMFFDEARIAAMLNHPNVVQIFDLGRIGNDFFIAMEYLSGESLSYVIKECRKQKKDFPWWLAAAVVAQAAEGLHHAHTATGKDGKPLGIVHRDVSPQNIFVLYDGGVKVVDFGIARAATRTTKTRTGTLKGKYAYMSPEQVAGKELDGRSDIFSLGVVLWECLVGRRLFNQENDLDLLKAVIESQIPDPRQFNPGVPETLSQITLKALGREREQRQQTAEELASDLRRVLKTCPEDWDNQALRKFMQELCRERIQKKREVIEKALHDTASLENSLFGDMSNYVSDTEYSVPRTTPSRIQDRPAPVQKKPFWYSPIPWMLFSLVTALALGLLFFFRTSRPEPPPARSENLQVETPPKEPQPPAPVNPPAPAVEEKTETNQTALAPSAPSGAPDKTPGVKVAQKAEGPRARPKPKVAPKPPEPSPQKIASGPPGKLRLITNPWTEVFYEGRAIGQTPLVDVELPPGPVKLRLVNREQGIDRTVIINITPGERTVKKLDIF
jgi:serine/threonine protein kinase